eukprot:TRINITY_DN31678_c0_g2_i1.p2 TRINITY_DN31678_c0_g2~~TRINITY_DN31678_c0_g2_i1.p2  ORF type:complete len:215 (-),score=23.92 TRINITY_DN31678_c0_g2_i1:225-869(-)
MLYRIPVLKSQIVFSNCKIQPPTIKNPLKRTKQVCCNQTQQNLIQQKTYLNEEFVQYKASNSIAQNLNPKNTLKTQGMNHLARETRDVEKSFQFYRDVLGFEELPRPPFPFGGKWIKCGELVLHLIEMDPTIPLKIQNWRQKFEVVPEPWYIRRSTHIALEVTDVELAEQKLQDLGIDYDKFVIPGNEDCKQLFFYDPDGHGVEIGNYYVMNRQ